MHSPSGKTRSIGKVVSSRHTLSCKQNFGELLTQAFSQLPDRNCDRSNIALKAKNEAIVYQTATLATTMATIRTDPLMDGIKATANPIKMDEQLTA